jgi:hypothetical protein
MFKWNGWCIGLPFFIMLTFATVFGNTLASQADKNSSSAATIATPAVAAQGNGAATAPVSQEKPGDDTAVKGKISRSWIIWSIIMLILVMGAWFLFMFVLQGRYLRACEQNQQIALFSQSPAGVPEGTIRAAIALSIIFVSLYVIILVFFGVSKAPFPEVLSSLLGAVVGFYFGSRTAGKGDSDALQDHIADLKSQRDAATDEVGKKDANDLLGKVKSGLTMAKTVLAILPEDIRKKYGPFIDKIESGAKVVESMAGSGQISSAVESAKKLYSDFSANNPIKNAYSTAVTSVGKVLGGNVPAIAFIAAAVGLTVKLTDMAYTKWKKRVLDASFSPADLPITAMDSNVAFQLLLKSPTFKQAFKIQIEGNNNPFMLSVLDLLKPTGDSEKFFAANKDAFAGNRAEFEIGLKQFRHAALDLDLSRDLASQHPDIQRTLDTLSTVNDNPQAKADFQQLFTVVEHLQLNGQPVNAILENAQKEVSDGQK